MIVDQANLEFADDFEHRPLADLVRAGENVVVFRTFAKAFGLGGIAPGETPRAETWHSEHRGFAPARPASLAPHSL